MLLHVKVIFLYLTFFRRVNVIWTLWAQLRAAVFGPLLNFAPSTATSAKLLLDKGANLRKDPEALQPRLQQRGTGEGAE